MFCVSKHEDEDDKLYTKQFFKMKKLLLLGTGESGKTTILKQMKILHINGFSDIDKREKIPNIRQNIHESIYDIVANMDKINPPIEIEDETTRTYVDYILELGSEEPIEYTNDYFDKVTFLWADKNVQQSFKRSNEYQLIDSAEYFLNRIDTIRQEDYLPSTQDILICRIKTVSITKTEFQVAVPKKYGGGTAEFCLYDVGGQRGERKKWIQVFDGIEAILFLIAASDFDLKLREDHSKNRLEEAFALFKDICFSRFVRNSGLIVFLNKQDMLQRKLEEGKKLEEYFPEFSEYVPKDKLVANNTYERAKYFMQQKLEDIADQKLTIEKIGFLPGKNIKETLPPRQVYIHFTTATDTNNVKRVFESVHDIILSSIIRDLNF